MIEEGQKLLELNTRRKIYEIVKKFAGSHFREIERKSKLSTGTVQYHLSFLAKHNLIKEEKIENNLRYFPEDFNTKDKNLLGILRQKNARNILLIILTKDKCNHEKIENSIKLSPSTISWYLKKLKKNNLIKFIKEGRKTFYHLTIDRGEIVKLLITYQESFLDSLVDQTIDMWE